LVIIVAIVVPSSYFVDDLRDPGIGIRKVLQDLWAFFFDGFGKERSYYILSLFVGCFQARVAAHSLRHDLGRHLTRRGIVVAILSQIRDCLFELRSFCNRGHGVRLIQTVLSLPLMGRLFSRGAHDAQIFTNDASALGQGLSRDVSHAPVIQQAPVAQKIEPQPAHVHEIAQGFGMGM